MSQQLPLLRSLSVLSTRRRDSEVPAVMACRECEVTWRDVQGAPCWFCGEIGELANPKRLVLD